MACINGLDTTIADREARMEEDLVTAAEIVIFMGNSMEISQKHWK